MKRKKTLDAKKPSMIVVGVRFALAMISLAILCIGAVAEDEKSANYWYEKSLDLYNNGSLEESLQAVDKAIELDPENATLWAYKASGLNLAGVITQNQSRFDESLQVYDRAIELDPENTTYLLWKGFALRQAVNGLRGQERIQIFEEAIETFDRALEIDPKFAEAWAGKGVICDDLATFNNDSARYNDSLAAYDKAIELAPTNDSRNLAQAYEGKAVALSHMGQDLAARGQIEESRAVLKEAVKNYDKVIDLDPDFVGQEAQQNRAGVLKELGRRDEAAAGYEKAIEQLNRSIEVNLNNSGAWVNKAILFQEQGRYEEAITALNNATKITPEYVMAWEMMGEILSNDLGRYDESIEAYDRALQLDPSDARAWTSKGHALRSLGRNREAVLAYDRALKIDPNRATAWSGKGAALRDQGRYNESVQAYDEVLRAVERDPTYRYSSAALAVADAWLGKSKAESLMGPDKAEEAAIAYNESLQAYEKAIQIDPESARAWIGRGNALLSLEKYSDSTEAYERAVEVLNDSLEEDPEDAEAWWLKAESLDNLGRSDEALQAYDRVIELNSSKAIGAWIRKSDIFVSLGRYNESVEAFDGALNLLPTKDKQSIMGLWWAKGMDIYHNAWIADGQIVRTTSAWRNQSTGGIENIMMVNSDFTAAWQRPTSGKGFSPEEKPLGRHDEALQALSTNWADYGFPNSKETAQVKIADDWVQTGRALFRSQSFEGAAEAYEKAIGAAGSNKSLLAEACQGKGEAFLVLSGSEKSPGKREEANESLEKALDYFDQVLEIYPENAGAWLNKSFILRWMGRTGEALDAVDRAVELNPENIDFRWQRAELLSMLGRYNESDKAFDETIEMIPANSSRKLAEVWTFKGINFMGQNNSEEALKAFVKVTELDPQEPAGWLYKGEVLKALGRQAEADEACARAGELDNHFRSLLTAEEEANEASTRVVDLGYNVQKESDAKPSSTPKMLAITRIMVTGEDEFVVVANSRAAAQSLNGWTLDVIDGRNGSRNQSVTLPDFIIDPDERTNIHLGKGESNETDVFLNSAITLNDTAGNITLKDDTGMIVASFEYRVEPDGSITGIMTAEGEFSYPSSGQNEVKMVVRETGSGPYVTERTEYEPEAANYSWIRNTSLERSGKEML
ncbi:tetratricopeptide repeat protein [Methanothrix soehngenii]|jgi:tetratricopeptide (TPR) repeat protein|uniref:tetratricopeptide repeat protein n=1 Tax=Methanothrix soehngenii TaxID=2223 RepID=UPI002357FC1C|nr:tetratricopeptide repeat protein [Methanothrix soehngenii]HOE45696.1 tetratricopeptide repeat protein [Methanothrix soehngenii]HOS22552.1 tetratricopeptide repeat protein [Methanothrix soehngenii]HPL20876.1 tetratricopeptide repeat protein [Methanothrix soehngenii]